jgi:DNA polymerase-3 subunit gamma/tau
MQRDPKHVLRLLDEAEKEGLQLGELLDQLIAYWRDLMVVHCAGAEARDVSVSARHRDTLKQQATGQRLETILAGLDILAATKNRLRGSSHSRTWLEMALVRLTRLEDLISVGELAKSLGAVAESPSGNPTLPAPGPAPARPRLADHLAAPEARPLAPPSTLVAPARPVAPALVGAGVSESAGSLRLTAETLPEVWSTVITQVGRMVANVLEKAAMPAILGPNSLAIRFPQEYNLECKHFQDHGGLEKTVAILRNITGQPWSLRVESAQEQSSSSRPPAGTEEKDAAPASRQQLEDKALQDPFVKHVKEVLNASFLKVDEGFGSLTAAASEASEEPETEDA